MKNYRFIWAFICVTAALLSAGQAAYAAPSNDHYTNPLPIGNVTNWTFSTVGADHDSAYAYCNGANIWYCYTATCTGEATVSLCGTAGNVDTMLAVYNGCQGPNGSNRIAYNDDDYNCGVASTLTFDCVYGNQYLIEVGHYNIGVYTDQGKISISCTPETPNNDNIANAQVIGNVVDLLFDTTGATHDGPISVCDMGNGPNIWYKYVATCTGPAVISLCGSSFDTILAVYSGTSSSNLSIIGCNDDWCGDQSQVTVNVTSGKSYWIEISGRGTGAGKLNISCNGQTQQASDLGDAPDSSNHFGANMRTYDGFVYAHFPTVYQGTVNNRGPIHLQPKKMFYLGDSVTFEDEADQGYDEDGVNNIIPTQANVNADKDLGDDGVIMLNDTYLGKTLGMNHCKLTSFDYKVKVVDIDPNVDMWVNVWIDWNRDGDWNDDSNNVQNMVCTSCSGSGFVSEWAVQNQLLYGLHKGTNTITTPGFLAWHPEDGSQKIWMRITLSDKPWKGGTGAAGSGPADGYEYGETEDYYFTPKEDCAVCEDLNRDNVIDELDLFTYMLRWLDTCMEEY